ncbi:AAA family ATPase [Methylobacterium sp. E-046]|uniref:AAA family ATPase n=1 Tax=Methylobacterium sp. E-046 TaxID=2836576 RepID=UPI001FBAB8F5|nr:AAA family ATPase [Methylobacterium sp. E-046]MCJ2098444.1 helicase RepA family protein [Methylobacterium sp. E-046]
MDAPKQPDLDASATVHPFRRSTRDADADEGRFPPFEGQTGGAAAPIRATPFVLRDPRSIPRRQWLYGRHYIRRYPTATVAPGGLGKTSLILVEALAMATGKPLLGVRVPEPLRVWVWNGEDPREEIERRLAAACIHYGITADDIGDRLFIDSGREIEIVVARKVGDAVTVMAPIVEAVVSEIQARRIDVLTIDPFVSCHAVPENDNGAIDKVTKTWGGIGERCNCCVELVHHVRKAASGQTSYAVEDARGGSALIGAVRSARVLNVMSPEEAEGASVPSADRRRFFRVDDGKSNMAPPLEKADWRELISIGLGNDTLDGPEDQIGVVTPWTMPGLFDAVEVSDLRRVQTTIAAGEWAESVQAGNWAGHAIAEALDIDADTAGGKTKLKALLKTWIASKALKVARQHDARNGRAKPMIVVGEPA